jgi:hypothetical protein
MSESGSSLSLGILWDESVDDLAVVLLVVHLGYVMQQLLSSSPVSPASPVLYVFIPIDIFGLFFFFARWVKRIGNLSVAVVALVASLCGILMSVFIAYTALATGRSLLSQACLFAVGTILLCEVFYVRGLIATRARLTGGINAITS